MTEWTKIENMPLEYRKILMVRILERERERVKNLEQDFDTMITMVQNSTDPALHFNAMPCPTGLVVWDGGARHEIELSRSFD